MTDTLWEREKKKQTDRERQSNTEAGILSQTERETQNTETKTDILRDTVRDRQTDKETDRDKEIQRRGQTH